ncbi:MAG: hypothetical protein PHT30_01490 [Bacilli bacterium]|nr:hypothetical protein [Bacilli bacterium]
MKKKVFYLVPVLLSLFLSACNLGGSSTPTSEDTTKIQYTITFKDEEDNTLESKKWDEG